MTPLSVIARSAATKQSRWDDRTVGTRLLRFARNDSPLWPSLRGRRNARRAGAGDPDLHRVEGAAARFDIGLELGDELDHVLGEVILPEQQIVAAPRHLGD